MKWTLVVCVLSLALAGCVGPVAKKSVLTVNAPSDAAFSKAILALQDANATIKNTDEKNGILTAEYGPDPATQVSIVILPDQGDGKTRVRINATNTTWGSEFPNIITTRFIQAYQEYVGEVVVEPQQ